MNRYKLIRERDGLIKVGNYIDWISWKEDGKFKEKHDKPAIGRSLVIDGRQSMNYTWLTTDVTEILAEEDNYIKFKTKNSTYELYIEINK
jgi:hypothetical protein